MNEKEQLRLQDVLQDNPQTRSLLSVFEKDAIILKKYCTNFLGYCQRIMKAQNEMCSATQALSQHLKDFDIQHFSLEEDDSILSSTLSQFSSYLDDISSIQQVLSAQLSENMIYPCSKFLQADLEEISTLMEMFNMATKDHESAMGKYMRFPRKGQTEKARLEVNHELFMMRKKFHQTGLHYFASLNALQYKKKCSLLEPLVGYLHAYRSFFKMGQDAVGTQGIGDFLTSISSSIQGVQQDLNQETRKTVDLIASLEKQSAHLYHAEPPPDMPYIPPNTNLVQKAGYLYQRSKQLLVTRYEKCFFFVQGGNLNCQSKDQVAGSVVLDLTEGGVIAEPYDADDRRFIFRITTSNQKKSIVLQAENEREKDEWIYTINNVVRQGSSSSSSSLTDSTEIRKVKDLSNSKQSLESIEKETAKISDLRTSVSLDVNGPIQFDLLTENSEDSKSEVDARQPIQRSNVAKNLSESNKAVSSDPSKAEFEASYIVRFLGCMDVAEDRGDALVHETMRQIIAARAIHNVFKMTESEMKITGESIRLVDATNDQTRTTFHLKDISFWTVHPENKRLLGFVTRNRNSPQASRFSCHVFECNISAEEVCQSIVCAAKIAFQNLIAQKKGNEPKKTKPAGKVSTNKEKSILLANISQLEDAEWEDEVLCGPLAPDIEIVEGKSSDVQKVEGNETDLDIGAQTFSDTLNLSKSQEGCVEEDVESESEA